MSKRATWGQFWPLSQQQDWAVVTATLGVESGSFEDPLWVLISISEFMDVLAIIWAAWLLKLDVVTVPLGMQQGAMPGDVQAQGNGKVDAASPQERPVAPHQDAVDGVDPLSSSPPLHWDQPGQDQADVSPEFDSDLSQGLSQTLSDPIDWQLWAGTPQVSVEPVDGPILQHGAYCVPVSQVAPVHTAKAAATQASSLRYQLKVRGVAIGEVSSLATAQQLAIKLRRALQAPDWDGAALKPLLGSTFAAGSIHQEILFVVDQPMLVDSANPAAVAIQWINNLRVATGANPLSFADIQMLSQNLDDTGQRFSGLASWYGPYFHGRQTATGEIFNQHELTAAHPSLPFGTYLKVRNQLNGKTVVVRVNDRGPYVGDRSLDLSRAAAQCLGSERVGVIPFTATILKTGQPLRLDEQTLAAN